MLESFSEMQKIFLKILEKTGLPQLYVCSTATPILVQRIHAFLLFCYFMSLRPLIESRMQVWTEITLY